MVPSIAVMPREGSLALAFLGKMRKAQESAFSRWSARGRAGSIAGRKSFALKRILEAALVICLVSLIVMHFLDAAGSLAQSISDSMLVQESAVKPKGYSTCIVLRSSGGFRG